MVWTSPYDLPGLEPLDMQKRKSANYKKIIQHIRKNTSLVCYLTRTYIEYELYYNTDIKECHKHTFLFFNLQAYY